MASTLFILSALLVLISATPVELTPSGTVCVNDNVLRALQNPTRTKDSYPFCSSYIGHGPTSTKYLYTTTTTVPVVTRYFGSFPTITATSFTNMHEYYDNPDAPAPITYPTPQPAPTTTILGGVPSCLSPAASQITTVASTTTVTSGLATTRFTSIETVSASTVVTYAAICAPSVFMHYQWATAAPSRAVRTVLPTPILSSKADCCQVCADTLNCMYWEYGPSGKCKVVYGTDNLGIAQYNNPDLCPNGIASGGFQTPIDPATPTVYGVGQCAEEVGNVFESSFEWFDECAEWGGEFCNPCAVFGGESCN
ncbi:MAG: hypothetical protein Q9191_006363 [Dirinaria sp. TL-2023a]